jgi:hypothetical protein
MVSGIPVRVRLPPDVVAVTPDGRFAVEYVIAEPDAAVAVYWMEPG